MARVLVLGAGFGGIPTAIEARRLLPPEHDVVLVGAQDTFLMGLAKLWALDGRRPLDAGTRPVRAVERHGVRFVHARATALDTTARTVDLEPGGKLGYDALILALGARLAPEAVPGFDAAMSLYDPTQIPGIHRALESLDAGRVLVVVAGMPFKCPPAPYEAAILIHDMLTRRGVRDRVEIELTTPEPRPLPIAPASCSSDLKAFLDQARVIYAPDHAPVRVDPEARTVTYANGATRSYDLLIGVPPHRAPQLVHDAGLTNQGGWVPVDPATLRTRVDRVWAIGDVAAVPTPGGKPLPKAGVFAEAQGKVAASHAAAALLGTASEARFDGHGSCFLEVGQGTATAVEGDFFHESGPQLTMAMPTAEALERKRAFEADRLRAWFGS